MDNWTNQTTENVYVQDFINNIIILLIGGLLTFMATDTFFLTKETKWKVREILDD